MPTPVPERTARWATAAIHVTARHGFEVARGRCAHSNLDRKRVLASCSDKRALPPPDPVWSRCALCKSWAPARLVRCDLAPAFCLYHRRDVRVHGSHSLHQGTIRRCGGREVRRGHQGRRASHIFGHPYTSVGAPIDVFSAGPSPDSPGPSPKGPIKPPMY